MRAIGPLRRPIIVVAAVAFLVIPFTSSARAFSCIRMSPSAADAEVVFIGTVVSAQDPQEDQEWRMSPAPKIWRFNVDSVQRGAVRKSQDLYTEAAFAVGGRYQVFASRGEKGLRSEGCAEKRDLSSTRPYLPAGAEAGRLLPGREHIRLVAAQDGGFRPVHAILTSGGFGLALAYLLLRTKRAPGETGVG